MSRKTNKHEDLKYYTTTFKIPLMLVSELQKQVPVKPGLYLPHQTTPIIEYGKTYYVESGPTMREVEITPEGLGEIMGWTIYSYEMDLIIPKLLPAHITEKPTLPFPEYEIGMIVTALINQMKSFNLSTCYNLVPLPRNRQTIALTANQMDWCIDKINSDLDEVLEVLNLNILLLYTHNLTVRVTGDICIVDIIEDYRVKL